MVHDGELRTDVLDGVTYVWPSVDGIAREAPHQVRFIAPFDPVVWDRARFEHLWRWAYRFEAYTPVKKRVRGYYAMPMLWRDHFVGWVNATMNAGKLDVKDGYVAARPRDREFRRELDAEIDRLDSFLQQAAIEQR
jgi:uncharacterized protein YcaQ